MRRIINFRAPLFFAIGLILGIFSFYEFLFGDFWFGLITLICIFAIGVLLFVLKSKTWIGIIAVILAVIIGFFSSHLSYFLLGQNEAVNRNVIIVGRVSDLVRNGTDASVYYLEDCVDDNGVSYAGRIETYIFENSYETGDVITIRGVLNSVYPIKASPQAYYLRSNIRYKLDAERVVAYEDGNLKLDEIIRKYIYDTTAEYAPENGDVLYALLTGDRSALSPEKEDYFKVAGIIHLLAVSGLHVGFVVTILGFLLKRFKLHPLIELAIMIVPLVFYAYICDFTPSVIRAIVMVACTYLARAVFGRYDLLTSLSLAVIVILIISPLSLFDLGFQLSVLSVYGIATFYSFVNRLLSTRKLPSAVRYVVNLFAVSLSCSLATFFTLQLNYGYAPILGVLLNIIVIPFVTVAYIIGWIGLIPWIFHYVLWLVNWIIEAVVVMARWVANLSFATVSVPVIAFTIVVVVLWLFVLSGYVNLRKLGRIITGSVLALAIAVCIGLSFVKLSPQNQLYVSYGYEDVICVATSSDGEAAIVGNFTDRYSYAQAVKYLNKYNIESCVLYLTDISTTNDTLLQDALNCLPVKSAYKLNSAYNSAIEEIFASHGIELFQQIENTSLGDSIAVTSVYDNELRAVVIRLDGITATSVYGNDYVVSNYLDLCIPSDIYILPHANKAYSDNSLTTLSMYQSQLPFNYGANKYGTFTITQKGDKISVKFR